MSIEISNFRKSVNLRWRFADDTKKLILPASEGNSYENRSGVADCKSYQQGVLFGFDCGRSGNKHALKTHLSYLRSSDIRTKDRILQCSWFDLWTLGGEWYDAFMRHRELEYAIFEGWRIFASFVNRTMQFPWRLKNRLLPLPLF